jgi:hypothetical protein
MQILGQHQTKGLTLKEVKICLVKKTRKIKVIVNLVRVVHTGIIYCTKDFIRQKAASHSTSNII